jgi:hypothetical protein
MDFSSVKKLFNIGAKSGFCPRRGFGACDLYVK